MIKISLIFLALFFSNYFLSQKSEEKTINEWLTENNFIDNNDYLYHTSIPKSTNKMGDSEIEALIKTEKELSNKSLKNMIYENSKELSFIDFNNLEKYYSYTDRKTIQVVCVINKKTVSDYWVKDIERKLENLKSSLSESQITGQLTSSKIEEMLNNTKVIRKEIDRYEQIAFKLNPKMDMSIINLFKTDIDGRINDLNSRMDKTVFNEKLSSARRKINNQDYIGSYIAYKDLQLEYPNNTDVIYGIDESFNSLIKNYDQRLSQYG
jgi:MFS superfamily sulfate permease-like transporter